MDRHGHRVQMVSPRNHGAVDTSNSYSGNRESGRMNRGPGKRHGPRGLRGVEYSAPSRCVRPARADPQRKTRQLAREREPQSRCDWRRRPRLARASGQRRHRSELPEQFAEAPSPAVLVSANRGTRFRRTRREVESAARYEFAPGVSDRTRMSGRASPYCRSTEVLRRHSGRPW